MKVLITGGYGFIGSHVAEQFHKEGYEVFIIDNLSTGKKENVPFKHKSYILSVDDSRCKEIFKSYRFDIVVHLAAQVSVSNSIVQPAQDANTNIVGLIQMLQLAAQGNVKKFLFASSAAVYGENENIPLLETSKTEPITPYGLSKLSGEEYCTYFSKKHDLETIVLRFSNVYGPRQTANSDGSVIATFINNITKQKPLIVHGDGEQTRDFIYVKDVAFLIYRAAINFIVGKYNVSTNTETSINELIEMLTLEYPDVEVSNIAKREGDITRSILDNSHIKSNLDWVPIYTLQEGLGNTIAWAKTQNTSKTVEIVEEKAKIKLPNWTLTIKPYVENLLIFALIGSLTLVLDSPIITPFVFGLFYIITIGSIYGSTQAFTGVVLATSLLVFEHQINGREFLSLLYDTTFLFQIATFLFIGLVVGYSVQKKNNIIAEQSEQLEDLQLRYDHLDFVHNEVKEIKEELQVRVRNNEDSLGKIHSIIKELNNLEPEKIFSSTVKVVEKLMHTKDVSIYAFNNNQNYLRLIARSDLTESKFTPTSIKVENTPFVSHLLEKQKLYINKVLLPNEPLMAVPLSYQSGIKAIITINDLSFEQFSKYHENLFIVISKLIEASIERAFRFLVVTENKRYIPNTKILTEDIFNEIIQVKEIARNDNNSTFQLIRQTADASELVGISDKITPLLRETDYVAYVDQQIYVLLSNTQNQYLPLVLDRFNRAGFNFEHIEKVGI